MPEKTWQPTAAGILMVIAGVILIVTPLLLVLWGELITIADYLPGREPSRSMIIYGIILKSLPGEYCANPQPDVLSEFIQTLTGITDEYPTYVFAELYACDPDRVIKEIQSLTGEDQKKIVENLDWGCKIMTYKIESLPNYKELMKKLDNLKRN